MITRRSLVATAVLSPIAAKAESRRIVVTGHLGNIGQRLLPILRGQRYKIVGIDKRNGPEENLALDVGAISKLRDADAVIHLAACANPQGSHADVGVDSIDATTALLKGCEDHGVSRIIYASSTWISPGHYGNPEAPSAFPVNWYGFSKAMAEEQGRIFARAGRTFLPVRIGWVPVNEAAVPTDDSPRSQWLRRIRLSDGALWAAFERGLSALSGFNIIETVARSLARME